MDSNKKINNLRKEIDKIDQKLMILLLKRFSITREIGQIKASNRIDIDDSDRENQIIMYLSTKANSDLKKEDISDIFELIFNISKKNQKIK
jgi:chorismate mutase